MDFDEMYILDVYSMAIVLPGVTIGDGTIVGAGSVVTKDLPPEMVCVGVPARPLKPRPKS